MRGYAYSNVLRVSEYHTMHTGTSTRNCKIVPAYRIIGTSILCEHPMHRMNTVLVHQSIITRGAISEPAKLVSPPLETYFRTFRVISCFRSYHRCPGFFFRPFGKQLFTLE